MALLKAKPAAGGGQLGEGAFRGYLAREKIDREKEESSREDTKVGIAQEYLGIAKENLGMRKEEHGWKREDREKEQSILNGMIDASKDGGYEGVIDFLKEVDPTRAIKFDQAKKNLDTSIMKNDVMQSTSKLHKDKAMVESYAVLGKMGQGILQAPPEDQQKMYKQMLPMIKKINPNAPSSYDEEAKGMFMLSASQATPSNQLFKANKDVGTTNSRYAKLISDRDSRPVGSKQYKELDAEVQRHKDKAAEAGYKLAEIKEKAQYTKKMSGDQVTKALRDANKDITQASKNFIEYTQTNAKTDAAADVLEKNPRDFSSAAMVARGLARLASGGGTMNDKDIDDVVLSETGFKSLKKYIASKLSGNVEDFSGDQIDSMLKLYRKIGERNVSNQRAVESRYENIYKKNPESIYNDLKMPLQVYQEQKQSFNFVKTLPEGFKEKAQSLLDKGVPLKQVMEYWNSSKAKNTPPAEGGR